MPYGVIPGLTRDLITRRHYKIPAFAGMTLEAAGMTLEAAGMTLGAAMATLS